MKKTKTSRKLKEKTVKKSVPKAKKKIIKSQKKATTKVTMPKTKKETKKAKPVKQTKKQSKFYTTDLIKPTEDQIKTFEHSLQGIKKKEVQGKETYHLYEDLTIILEVVKLIKENNDEKQNFWKQLAEKNILKRSQESLRDRFKRQLRYLTAKDYTTICQHLKQKGECSGYLEFQFVNADNKAKGKFLNSITLEDPRLIKNPSADKKEK